MSANARSAFRQPSMRYNYVTNTPTLTPGCAAHGVRGQSNTVWLRAHMAVALAAIVWLSVTAFRA